MKKPVLFLWTKSYAKRAGVRLPERVVSEVAMRIVGVAQVRGVRSVSARDRAAVFEVRSMRASLEGPSNGRLQNACRGGQMNIGFHGMPACERCPDWLADLDA